jgi:hypothetical protein
MSDELVKKLTEQMASAFEQMHANFADKFRNLESELSSKLSDSVTQRDHSDPFMSQRSGTRSKNGGSLKNTACASNSVMQKVEINSPPRINPRLSVQRQADERTEMLVEGLRNGSQRQWYAQSAQRCSELNLLQQRTDNRSIAVDRHSCSASDKHPNACSSRKSDSESETDVACEHDNYVRAVCDKRSSDSSAYDVPKNVDKATLTPRNNEAWKLDPNKSIRDQANIYAALFVADICCKPATFEPTNCVFEPSTRLVPRAHYYGNVRDVPLRDMNYDSDSSYKNRAELFMAGWMKPANSRHDNSATHADGLSSCKPAHQPTISALNVHDTDGARLNEATFTKRSGQNVPRTLDQTPSYAEQSDLFVADICKPQPTLTHNANVHCAKMSLERQAQMRAEALFGYAKSRKNCAQVPKLLERSDALQRWLRRVAEYCDVVGIDESISVAELITSRLSDDVYADLQQLQLHEEVWLSATSLASALFGLFDSQQGPHSEATCSTSPDGVHDEPDQGQPHQSDAPSALNCADVDSHSRIVCPPVSVEDEISSRKCDTDRAFEPDCCVSASMQTHEQLQNCGVAAAQSGRNFPRTVVKIFSPSGRKGEMGQPSEAAEIKQPDVVADAEQPNRAAEMKQPNEVADVEQPNEAVVMEQPNGAAEVKQLSEAAEMTRPNEAADEEQLRVAAMNEQQPDHVAVVEQPQTAAVTERQPNEAAHEIFISKQSGAYFGSTAQSNADSGEYVAPSEQRNSCDRPEAIIADCPLTPLAV